MKTLLFSALLGLLLLAYGSQAQAEQRNFAVRETVGSVQIKGWEQSLIQGDHNLAHWHWDPIYANVQGMKVLGPGGQTWHPKVPAGPRYVKPVHVQTVITPPPPRPQPDYVKDIFKERPEVQGKLSNNNLQGKLSNSNLQGTLAHRNTKAMLADKDTSAELRNEDLSGHLVPPAPVVASYGANYGYTPAVSSYSSIQRAEVYGRIKPKAPVSKHHSHAIAY